MTKQEQQTFDTIAAEVARLTKLVHTLSARVRAAERDNVRIKHELRTARAQIQALDGRTRGG